MVARALRVTSVLALLTVLVGVAVVRETRRAQATQDIHKIKHIVIIMQENRSFDQYFGTFPGADGIPMKNAVPTVLAPDPATPSSINPFHDPNHLNSDPPHSHRI